jgi:hypothetical protein
MLSEVSARCILQMLLLSSRKGIDSAGRHGKTKPHSIETFKTGIKYYSELQRKAAASLGIQYKAHSENY